MVTQLESLQLAANNAAQSVNARGAMLEIRLQDIRERVREIALHGVRHGATITLAAAQVHSGHELRLFPHGFLATDDPRIIRI